MAFVSLGMGAIFHYALHRDLLRHPPPTPAAVRAERLRTAVPVVVFALSVPVAFLSPAAAVAMWFLPGITHRLIPVP
jgi:hypothetical protein